MRQKRRVLTILLTLAIVLVMMPVSGLEFVSADSGDEGSGSEGFYTPLKIESGFNTDCVIDDMSENRTESGIDSAGYCFYSFDGELGSLPLGGVITTDSGKHFKLGDYTNNNVLKLGSVTTGGTLSFSEGSKGKYSSIALLATGGNGGGSVEATVHFEGETEPVRKTLFVPDWGTGSFDQKMYDCGRWKLDKGWLVTTSGFGLYECVISIPNEYRSLDLKSVELKRSESNSNDSTICIFAASGISTSVNKTVIFDADGGTFDVGSTVDNIISVESGAEIVLPAVKRENYSFEGWFDGITQVGDDENKCVVNDDVVLKARWEEATDYIDCFLGYYYNNRTVKLFRKDSETFAHPHREGYIFAGFAEESGGEAIPESELNSGGSYYALWEEDTPLYVHGIEVTEENCNNVLNDEGSVQYDIDKRELTLNNANLTAESIISITEYGEYAEIYRDGDLKLNLIGKNTITCNTENPLNLGIHAICLNDGRLDIGGNGSLEINLEDAGADDVYGISAGSSYINAPVDITVRSGQDARGFSLDKLVAKSKINIDAIGGNSASGIELGGQNSDIEFRDSTARIAAESTGGGDSSYGIFIADKICVTGDSDLRISASYALNDIGQLDMKMGAKLEALGSKQAFVGVSLTDNTKALGIMTKSAADATGEYSIWTGDNYDDLCSDSVKGILIPGKDIKHVKEAAPTCTKAGNKEYWMLRTGEGTTYYNKPVIAGENECNYTDLVIPAKGHLFSDEFTTDTEPTCTEDGSKSKHCTVCGESDIETRTAIPALGHEWDEGVVTKEATATEEGVKTYTCSRCKETRTEPIPKITPDPSGDDTKPAPSPSGDESKPAPDSSDASVESGTVTLNSSIVNTKTVKAALKKAKGGSKAVTVLVLGKNVKKIKKGAFKNCRNVRTLVIKTKKLKKASVKNSLKGSRITKIRVRVSSKKSVNKKYVKKYKKLFTKKNAGRKVKVA